MKLLATTLAATLLSTAAFAQSADVSTIACKDLATMNADAITTMMFWIDGYMGGAAEDPTFDLDRLMANIDAAMTTCGENPDMTVMDALHQAENG